MALMTSISLSILLRFFTSENGDAVALTFDAALLPASQNDSRSPCLICARPADIALSRRSKPHMCQAALNGETWGCGDARNPL
jgi:hypothetical protein